MRDAACLVRLEAPNDLPARPYYMDISIIAAQEETVRSGTDGRYLVALKEVAGLVVGELDTVDVEEVEGLPLRTVNHLDNVEQGREGIVKDIPR